MKIELYCPIDIFSRDFYLNTHFIMIKKENLSQIQKDTLFYIYELTGHGNHIKNIAYYEDNKRIIDENIDQEALNLLLFWGYLKWYDKT